MSFMASASRQVFTVLLLGCSLLFLGGCSGGKAASAPPPPVVEVATVVQQDTPIYSEWVAILDGYVNAQIQPHVSGYIIRQNYKEGSVVKKGDVLFEIDPRPFKAALDQANAQLAQAEAQAAKASVEQAQLNVEWTKVTSLVTGIAGIAQVQIGNLVGTNSVLTSVSQVDPIKAFFPINEHEYLIAQSKGNTTSSNHTIRFYGTSIELILTDGSIYPQKGKVLLADRQVDPGTGTIRIVAAFPNPGNILRPGQYGRVRVQTSMKKGALLLPQSAVAQSQGSYQVAVVGSDHKVSMRTVKPGETVKTMWVIEEGLKPGEQVAAEGPQKLREGTLVTPQPVHHSGEGN